MKDTLSSSPIQDIPDPPDHFGEIARAEWFSLLKELKETKKLEVVDLPQLRVYCWNIQLITECHERLSKEGYIQQVKVNRTQRNFPNPSLKILNEATTIVYKIAGRFGFDPVSRTRIPTTIKETDHPIMKLIQGKQANNRVYPFM